MAEKPYTDADVGLAVEAIARSLGHASVAAMDVALDQGSAEIVRAEARAVLDALAAAGRLAPNPVIGRCGQMPPRSVTHAPLPVCALAAGHPGWHRSDDGCEWGDVPQPWALRAAATGGGPCDRCGEPFYTHVCLSCSPDAQTPGPGCVNCRNTGMDQTPCKPPNRKADRPEPALNREPTGFTSIGDARRWWDERGLGSRPNRAQDARCPVHVVPVRGCPHTDPSRAERAEG